MGLWLLWIHIVLEGSANKRYPTPMPELNAAQAQAVAHKDGPLLVFAGAGSGKTRTITYRIADLLATHRVPPYRILAVTFTNKAAGEMRQRIQQLAGDQVTRDLWLGTFHSVCARLLRRYHDEVHLSERFVIYDESDQKAVVARIIKELGFDERQYAPKFVLSKILAEKQKGRRSREVDLSLGFDEDLLTIFERYERALLQANAVDFEDLLLHVMRLAEDPESPAGRDLRQRFRYVLVDEFQDTNLVQYRLVRALVSAHGNLCVVGDDDQSIYRWRGADVRLIRGFQRDFPNATVVKLEQNYRSTANIVKAALGVIEPSHDREPKELFTETEPGEKVIVHATPDERQEAAYVVRGVQAELRRGTLGNEIAVFYRVHAQSRVLEEALRSENVNYRIIGGMRFFERAEIKNAIAYLRLLDNPKSDADLLRIINVPARGIGQKTVAKLLDTAAENSLSAAEALSPTILESALGAAQKKRLLSFSQLVDKLRAASESLGPRDLMDQILELSGYRQSLRRTDTAESDARLENLEELVGSLAEYESDAEQAGETPSISAYLERVSLVAAVDELDDTPSVSLMTVHSAKGLEFDTVFLTGMEEEVFPYRGLDAQEPEELDEERRLAYVAITRARKRLFITHAATRSLFGQSRYLNPSRFLDDLPGSVIQVEGEGRSISGGLFPGQRGSRARGKQLRDVQPGERVIDRSAFDDCLTAMNQQVRPGTHVNHRRFGRGVVESVEHAGAPSVTARFPGYGTRRILAKFLEFEEF